MEPLGPVLRLSDDVRAAMAKAARDGLPNEACGVLVGSIGAWEETVHSLEVCANTHPRPGAAYLIDLIELGGIVLRAVESGRDVVGSWHSHPATDAVPSRVDCESAFDSEWVLIISGHDGSVRAWQVRDGKPAELAVLPLAAEPRCYAAPS